MTPPLTTLSSAWQNSGLDLMLKRSNLRIIAAAFPCRSKLAENGRSIMNRDTLRDYGLSLGIECAEELAIGKTVRFMHDRQADIIWIEAYDRRVDFIDEGDYWIADECACSFRSRPLDDLEAQQFLEWWLDKDVDYLKYCDPAHHDPGHAIWLSRQKSPSNH
jgi:hypothetical protein